MPDIIQTQSLFLPLSLSPSYLLKILVQSKMKNSYILLDYYLFWVSFHRSGLHHHPYFIFLRQRDQVTCLLECPTSGFNWLLNVLMNLLLCLLSPVSCNLCVRIPLVLLVFFWHEYLVVEARYFPLPSIRDMSCLVPHRSPLHMSRSVST